MPAPVTSITTPLLTTSGSNPKVMTAAPVAQYYNPVTGQMEALQGAYGGAYSVLLDASGNVIFSTANPGTVNVASLPPLSAGANVIGSVKLTDGTNALVINTNGTLSFVPVDASGTELFTAGNPGNVSLAGSNVTDVTFQSAVGATGNGTAVSVKGYKTLVVEVYGASTPAGTVTFQAAGTSGLFADITGTNLNGFAQATSTSSIGTTPVQWQFDVEALDQFQCPVAWTSGTITVTGRLQA